MDQNTLSKAAGTLLKPRKNKGKWPNPGDSIGEKIQLQGLRSKYSCWKAVGPARQLFDDDLGPAITTFLSGFAPSDSDVYISFCFIGKTEETAEPKVIFSCSDRTVRKMLKKQVEQSSIMAPERCAGIGLGDNPTPPGPIPRLLAGDADDEPLEGKRVKSVPSTSVWATRTVIGVGDRLILPGNRHTVANQTKVTAGPIFYWKNRSFCLTVGHAFNNDETLTFHQNGASDSECDFDGLSDSDRETDEGAEHELMRRGSITSEEDNGTTRSQSSWDFTKYPTTSTSESSPHLDLLTSFPKSIKEKIGSLSGPIEENPPLTQLGVIQIIDKVSSLDYALIDVTGKIAPFPNIVCTSRFISECPTISGVAEIGSETHHIHAVTASSGPLKGTLSPYPSYARLSNNACFQRIYEIKLKGFITDGDSGAAVVDMETGGFYGHIFAGTPGTGKALLIPAVDVVKDAETQLGGSMSLTETQAQEAAALAATQHQRVSEFVESTAAALLTGGNKLRSEYSEVPSYPASIFSGESATTAISSQYSSGDLKSVAAGLVELIANDAVLKPLYSVAITGEEARIERFKRNFYRLLKVYGKELKSEAKSQFQFMAASFVHSQARPITAAITHMYAPIDDNGNPVAWRSPEQHTDRGPEVHAMTSLQLSETEDDELGEAPGLASFSEFKAFITTGQAFNNLRENLKDFVGNPLVAISRPEGVSYTRANRLNYEPTQRQSSTKNDTSLKDTHLGGETFQMNYTKSFRERMKDRQVSKTNLATSAGESNDGVTHSPDATTDDTDSEPISSRRKEKAKKTKKTGRQDTKPRKVSSTTKDRSRRVTEDPQHIRSSYLYPGESVQYRPNDESPYSGYGTAGRVSHNLANDYTNSLSYHPQLSSGGTLLQSSSSLHTYGYPPVEPPSYGYNATSIHRSPYDYANDGEFPRNTEYPSSSVSTINHTGPVQHAALQAPWQQSSVEVLPTRTKLNANDVLRPGMPASTVTKYDIPATSGEGAVLDLRYKRQQDPEKFFIVGRVFSVLWHESVGSLSSIDPQASHSARGKFGEPVYSSVRRMVVVKSGDRFAVCLPIHTYGGRGVARSGVDASAHAVIYTTGQKPVVSSSEPKLLKEPLAVDSVSPSTNLDRMSRLNFGKVYTVEHYVKVMPIGKISKESMPKFLSYAKSFLLGEYASP